MEVAIGRVEPVLKLSSSSSSSSGAESQSGLEKWRETLLDLVCIYCLFFYFDKRKKQIEKNPSR